LREIRLLKSSRSLVLLRRLVLRGFDSLLIVIAFPSIYNKYIFLNYAIFVTINITFVWYINMNNSLHEYYVYCINADHYNNYDYYYDNYYYYDDNFQNNTIGIIKSQDEKYSYVEYFIDDVKYNVKLLPLDFKVGQEVKVFYNKDNHEAIKIYDNTEKNKELINIIIGLFVLLLLWIFLFYNIPLILNLN
jgi:hypothetical protein